MKIVRRDLIRCGAFSVLPRLLYNATTAPMVREYSLALEREPTNKYDSNAVRVLDNTDSTAVVIGYLPKHVSAALAERYSAEMPISVIVKRAIKAPDGEIYLRLSPLIPKKSLRKHYEPSGT